jgi:hypothetical protein
MAQVWFNRANVHPTIPEHLANRGRLDWIARGGTSTMTLECQRTASLDVVWSAFTSTKAVSDGSKPQSA